MLLLNGPIIIITENIINMNSFYDTQGVYIILGYAYKFIIVCLFSKYPSICAFGGNPFDSCGRGGEKLRKTNIAPTQKIK